MSVVALGNCSPHRFWFRWPGDVAWVIPLTESNLGMIDRPEWQTYRSGHRAKLEPDA